MALVSEVIVPLRRPVGASPLAGTVPADGFPNRNASRTLD